jgi:hypothetical protein
MLDADVTTDTSKRPYVLICTKTRKRYQEKCEKRQADLEAMRGLASLARDRLAQDDGSIPNAVPGLQLRLSQALTV